MVTPTKTNRIDFRISEEDKKKSEKAAELNHLSLASYNVATVLKQADADIQQNELLLLNEKDAKLVMELLEIPTEPKESLIGLFE